MFDPDKARAVAEALAKADEEMRPAPWDGGNDWIMVVDNGEQVFSNWNANTIMGWRENEGIATLRNHARDASEQLRAACEEVERLRKDSDVAGLASIEAHAEYKQRRNAQFAAYEFAHRATVAYLLDRAEQYDNSSGYRALFDELIGGIAKWEHVSGAEAGEFDDLRKNVDRIIGKRKERSQTETERLQAEVAAMRQQLATVTAARDELADIAHSGWSALAGDDDWHEAAAAELVDIEQLRKAGAK